jgi:hypothetical protein
METPWGQTPMRLRNYPYPRYEKENIISLRGFKSHAQERSLQHAVASRLNFAAAFDSV